MTKVYIDDSSSNMKALLVCVFKLTGKRVKNPISISHRNKHILVDVRDDGVYLVQGRDLKESIVPVSLSEALTYIREQVFIQSLEK